MTDTTEGTVVEPVDGDQDTDLPSTPEPEYNALEMSDEDFLSGNFTSNNVYEVDHEELEGKGGVTTTLIDDNNEIITEEDKKDDDDPTGVVTKEGVQPGDIDNEAFKNNAPEGENDLEKLEKQSQQDPDTIPKYEEDWKELFEKPIRANNMDHMIRSVEDAKKLIQKGLGYGGAMAELKPFRRVQKMLENNNLLDESELSYLIRS